MFHSVVFLCRIWWTCVEERERRTSEVWTESPGWEAPGTKFLHLHFNWRNEFDL